MIINFAGGTGIMGTTHAPIFEKAGHKVIISGRKTSPSLEEAAQIADVTIVSVPIPATEEVISKVAPYSSALMDFTGVKTLPIEWMLDYSNDSCEVAGLHPLYRDPSSLKGQTIVYCPTFRTGNKCRGIVQVLEASGAAIKEMTAEEHDRQILSRRQNSRITLLTAYALLMEQSASEGISFDEFYKTSPPPTKAVIDIISRNFREDNDELYASMRKFNPYQGLEDKYLAQALSRAIIGDFNPAEIRKLFGENLSECQKRANKITSLYQ
jgi:prephenate dehydrogenase